MWEILGLRTGSIVRSFDALGACSGRVLRRALGALRRAKASQGIRARRTDLGMLLADFSI